MSFKLFIESFLPKVLFKTEIKPGYKNYIRSEDRLNSILDHVSVYNIAMLYANEKIALADNVILNMPTDDIFKYREYDRTLVNDFTGKMSKEELKDLKDNISTNGIKSNVIINIIERDEGIQILLGEGNHRVMIAKELNIPYIPVRFSYRGLY